MHLRILKDIVLNILSLVLEYSSIYLAMSKEVALQTGTCLFSGKRIETLLKKEADSNNSLQIWKSIEKSRCIQKADAQDSEHSARLRRNILSTPDPESALRHASPWSGVSRL